MSSKAAKAGDFLQKHYRHGMIGLVVVTAIAAGGKQMWERLSPKPEPTVSAQLARQYFARFSRLGVTAIKKEERENYIKVERDGKDTLTVLELMHVGPSTPSGKPWPPCLWNGKGGC